MRRFIGVAGLGFWLVSIALGAERLPGAMGFDDAGSVKAWEFHNGPEFPGAAGSISREASEGRAKPGCLALHYSFAGGGNYVQALCDLPGEGRYPPRRVDPARSLHGRDARATPGEHRRDAGATEDHHRRDAGATHAGATQAGATQEDAGAVRGVRVWLKKRGDNRITFRAVDSGGQTFQKSVDFTADGWQQLEVGLETWTTSWGGAHDRKVQFPIRQFGILVENSSPAKEGTLLVDDLVWEASAGAIGEQSSWYDLLQERWHAGGGAGNSLAGGTWAYAFDGGASPTLHAEYSLLGRPKMLRLVVESDGPGHAVHVGFGSHFQAFEREIGRLTQKGEQALEVSLEDMSGWKHYGGENNGQVRRPLRMQRLWLTAGEGAKRGEIRLKRIEVQTTFGPGEAVVLVPDAQLKGDEATFEVVARNLRSQESSGRLVCDVQSLDGRVAEESRELTLAGAARPVRQSFRVSMNGRAFAHATFRWVERGAGAVPAHIGVVRPLDKDGPLALRSGLVERNPAQLDPASMIGAGLYLYRWRGNPQAGQNMGRMAGLAREAGVKWSREEIQWHASEPREGQFDWSFYDQLVETAHRNGISVYGLLAYWSEWAKIDTPEGVEQYARWARQVVRHYKDRIKHWEIWNEPNIFFWSGPKELYAKLLTSAYEAIKAEDPEAVVMGCSTAGIDTEFIKNVVKWGGKFDALTIHPYRGVLDDMAYMRELQDVRKLVNGRPVWITEIGFPSQLIDGYSEWNQASLVARVYLASVASGAIANVSWYDFRNDGDSPFYNEACFGLVRHDFRLKPGYRSLATFGRMLAGMKLVGAVETGEGAYGFRFSDGKVDTVAVCAPRLGGLLTFESDAGITVVNGMGEAMQPTGGSTRRTITLDAGFPVYITGQAGFAMRVVEPALKLTSDTSNPLPGAKVSLRFPVNAEVTKWDVPAGWSRPVKVDDGLYSLAVPDDAVAGKVTVQAYVDMGGTLRLPLVLHVKPAVIRL